MVSQLSIIKLNVLRIYPLESLILCVEKWPDFELEKIYFLVTKQKRFLIASIFTRIYPQAVELQLFLLNGLT